MSKRTGLDVTYEDEPKIAVSPADFFVFFFVVVFVVATDLVLMIIRFIET